MARACARRRKAKAMHAARSQRRACMCIFYLFIANMPELRGYGQVGRTPSPGRCASQSRITLTVDQATNDMRKPATVPPPRVSLIVVARACTQAWRVDPHVIASSESGGSAWGVGLVTCPRAGTLFLSLLPWTALILPESRTPPNGGSGRSSIGESRMPSLWLFLDYSTYYPWTAPSTVRLRQWALHRH